MPPPATGTPRVPGPPNLKSSIVAGLHRSIQEANIQADNVVYSFVPSVVSNLAEPVGRPRSPWYNSPNGEDPAQQFRRVQSPSCEKGAMVSANTNKPDDIPYVGLQTDKADSRIDRGPVEVDLRRQGSERDIVEEELDYSIRSAVECTPVPLVDHSQILHPRQTSDSSPPGSEEEDWQATVPTSTSWFIMTHTDNPSTPGIPSTMVPADTSSVDPLESASPHTSALAESSESTAPPTVSSESAFWAPSSRTHHSSSASAGETDSSSNPSLTNTSTSTTFVGPLVGGIIGLLAIICLFAAGIWYIRRKFQPPKSRTPYAQLGASVTSIYTQNPNKSPRKPRYSSLKEEESEECSKITPFTVHLEDEYLLREQRESPGYRPGWGWNTPSWAAGVDAATRSRNGSEASSTLDSSATSTLQSRSRNGSEATITDLNASSHSRNASSSSLNNTPMQPHSTTVMSGSLVERGLTSHPRGSSSDTFTIPGFTVVPPSPTTRAQNTLPILGQAQTRYTDPFAGSPTTQPRHSSSTPSGYNEPPPDYTPSPHTVS